MHLEPEITRFCSVQRCRLLIGICAASFSRGGNPSYARHSTFSILIAENHSGIKIQNAPDKVNPAQLACDDQSLVSLSSLCWSWSAFVWSGPTFLRYHQAWPRLARGNQTHLGLWWNMCHELGGRGNESDFLWGVENLKFIIWMAVVKWDGNMVTAAPPSYRPSITQVPRLICPITNN